VKNRFDALCSPAEISGNPEPTMLNFLRIELFSFLTGLKESVYAIAEKVDYRMKSFKLNLKGNLIEKDLDRAFVRLGRLAFDKNQGGGEIRLPQPRECGPLLREIDGLQDQYSQSLHDLSLLQQKALRESLSHCSEQFQKTGWELVEIETPVSFELPEFRIKEIPLRDDLLVLMIKKGNEMRLANGETLLEPGDALISIGTSESIRKFKQFLLNPRLP
jgi:hypothetical protein